MPDPFDDPEFQRWADHVSKDAAPKIRESGATISLFPDGEVDVKLAVELGLSILYDKPIIAVVQAGRHLSHHLIRVCDEIVEWDDDGDVMNGRIMDALRRVEDAT